MQQSQFLLVVCSMWQRMESFTKCILHCRSSYNSNTLGESLSKVTKQQVEVAAKHLLEGKKTNDTLLQKLFTSIKGQAAAVGHSNEATKEARQRLFSLWHYFGPPCVFFTITPCDECSFRVRLYATSQQHDLPSIDTICDNSKCLLDFNARKKWRKQSPGACALEYESMLQIVIENLIGWNHETHTGVKGIFGVPLAYADCCEEQARYTLHSHISVWIEDFHDVRDLMFHEDQSVADKARIILQQYFCNIAQSTFGDLFDFQTNDNSTDKSLCKLNNILKPPNDQDLRNMRHHIHCLDHEGKVGYYPKDCKQEGSKLISNIQNGLDSTQIVQKNTRVALGGGTILNAFDKHQLDVLAYTYPYHMIDNCGMHRNKSQLHDYSPIKIDSLESQIKKFNLRYPMLQLRFNVHAHEHRKSCFKRGPECRTELPEKHRKEAIIFL